MKFIVDQDREQIYISTLNLYSRIVMHREIYIGVNLYQQSQNGKEQFLGTFDTLHEVISEMICICNTEEDMYCVSGYIENLYD